MSAKARPGQKRLFRDGGLWGSLRLDSVAHLCHTKASGNGRRQSNRGGIREEIYAYIDRHAQRFIEELAAFVRQPSISSHGVGSEACAALLAEMMRAAGIRVELLPMHRH